MTTHDLVRSWKDPKYRATLAQPPESPVGIVEIPERSITDSGAGEADCWTYNPTWCIGTCKLFGMGCVGVE